MAAWHRGDVLGDMRVQPGARRSRRSHRDPLPGWLRGRPVSRGMDGAAPFPWSP